MNGLRRHLNDLPLCSYLNSTTLGIIVENSSLTLSDVFHNHYQGLLAEEDLYATTSALWEMDIASLWAQIHGNHGEAPRYRRRSLRAALNRR